MKSDKPKKRRGPAIYLTTYNYEHVARRAEMARIKADLEAIWAETARIVARKKGC